MTENVSLHIAGHWRSARSGEDAPIINPATGGEIGRHPIAGRDDLDEALEAAERGFKMWRAVPAFDRSKIMRKAGDLLRERADAIARMMTIEQGKPLGEARLECLAAADVIDWSAEEGRRAYGRVVPARMHGVVQLVMREPVGPVAAFTPWNFPVNQAVRKIAAALCTGNSILLKGPEDTPASCGALVRVFLDAGVPGDVIGYVLGVPADISSYLIAHPVIRKISFTGSTPVGKQLASLAGLHMKRATMELGGHAPAIVCADADLGRTVSMLAAAKFRNAGQVCIAPTRVLVEDSVFEEFTDRFLAATRSMKVGNGLDEGVTMGPLAHDRRVQAMEALVADAKVVGAQVRTGGGRIGNQGFFFEPTVVTDVPLSARLMNEEPFGPIAIINRFTDVDDAIVEANRLPYGLAAYAYGRSTEVMGEVASRIESGMVAINYHGFGLPELPFGGVKESGYGSEGGSEAMDPYLVTKLVTHLWDLPAKQ